MIKFVVLCTADYSSNFLFLFLSLYFSLSLNGYKKKLLSFCSFPATTFPLYCCAVSTATVTFDPSRKQGTVELWLQKLSRSISVQFNPKQIAQGLYSLNLTALQVSKVNTTPALESDLQFHALSFLSSPLPPRSRGVISVHHMKPSAVTKV